MDEDDEDWLEDYNRGLHKSIAANNVKPSSPSNTFKASAENIDENQPPAVLQNGIASPNGSPSIPISPSIPTLNGHAHTTSSVYHGTETTIIAKNGHYPPLGHLSAFKVSNRKQKPPKDVGEVPPTISEDDFELIMDLLERATDQKCPTLHMVSKDTRCGLQSTSECHTLNLL